MRNFPLLALALVVTGCTLTPGTGFATLATSPLTLSFAPATGRLDEQGRLKTDTGYRLTLETLKLTVDSLVLQNSSSKPGAGGTATAFDPAKPPTGYTLCHGGHCHRLDGALIDYADIQADLASGGGGGGTTVQDVLTMPLNRTLNLALPSSQLRLDLCPTGCSLDQGTWSQAKLTFGMFEASGTVADGSLEQRLGPDNRRTWHLKWTPPAMIKRLAQSISRKSPPVLTLNGQVTISDQLFDQLDWEAITKDSPTLDLASQTAVLTQITKNFAE
ncbi:MAG: hypothetical protein H7338_08450, partial [Candidatus Sericytochromatia bacterium]|nr:hypothetical protein [Candidatus Sericytochromatia bacterium]